ncbi:hypothetical protein ABKN59_009653 [Abortiporus biennis]
MCYEVEIIGNMFKLKDVTWLFISVFSSIVAVDTLIASILCYSLWRMKTGFKKTDSQVETLIRYSVHTGALTSIVAMSTLIVFIALPRSFAYLAIFFTLPKLYLNALLATLNGRESIRVEIESATRFNSFRLSRLSRMINISGSVGSDPKEEHEPPLGLISNPGTNFDTQITHLPEIAYEESVLVIGTSLKADSLRLVD